MPLSQLENVEEQPIRSERRHLVRYINLKLAALGMPVYAKASREFLSLTDGLIRNHREKNLILSDHLCSMDRRVQAFLDDYLADVDLESRPQLPSQTFVLDKPGLARELSLPVDGDDFFSDIVSSYRLKNGVLHNPKADRRTTQGVFHVARGGLPVPFDKKSVPKRVFGNLLREALRPPAELMRLPWLANQTEQAETFVTLYLRPLVSPEIPGLVPEKRNEIRFFVPGGLVCNLDFVENIFGNAGDPLLAENDAALDVEHWTGHSGCIILAPHLTRLHKKDLGLPHADEATERQRREGMCWTREDELYNEGTAFKITARTERGVMVTLIADNYFGYCKKEVKTQLSFSANLYGLAEEEHAGGAVAFPRYSLGYGFKLDSRIATDGHNIGEVFRMHGDLMDIQPEGYGIDKRYPDIYYVPEDVSMDLQKQSIVWRHNDHDQYLHMQPNITYILPSGYKVQMEKNPGAPSWRLVGTTADGTFCHKPCTVSGGGKSEISKSLQDAIIFGPFFVADLQRDFDRVQEIFDRDYSQRFKLLWDQKKRSRPILSSERSLGSVIKLLTPSESEYNPEYNAWLDTIPDYIKAIVFIIKRFYKEEWGNNWREHFTADIINGQPGHEMKFAGRPLVANYLRIGLTSAGQWRTYKLRQDFIPAAKIQMEDDISATITVPRSALKYPGRALADYPSVKVIQNCESRLFQRPDDAIHRGFDKQTERDMAQDGNFMSNFEPLTKADARAIAKDTIQFHNYTDPMRTMIETVLSDPAEHMYFVSSAHPRIVNGKPSANPRYLQIRPDLENPRDRYVAEMGTRLYRRMPTGEKVIWPVNAVLAGRRNNPADKAAGVRALAVYNPIHYQELPELFMDFICSLTGKSPSTTGAGSEGALTKGPFNAIVATSDLNNALVSMIITGYQGFTTAAGCVGPKYRVDHDVSLLIPEIWCRLNEAERHPSNLIAKGCLEKLEDFTFEGEDILQSRLGYRMTKEFMRRYFGRIFDSPMTVFNEEMLKPELQDMDSYIDGIRNITEAQQGVARGYLDDGTVEAACPPIQALLHIMATGTWNGKTVHDPEVRALFTRESMLASDWYKERLGIKQDRERTLWQHHVESLEKFLAIPYRAADSQRLGIPQLLAKARQHLAFVTSPAYIDALQGTIGADPIARQRER